MFQYQLLLYCRGESEPREASFEAEALVSSFAPVVPRECWPKRLEVWVRELEDDMPVGEWVLAEVRLYGGK